MSLVTIALVGYIIWYVLQAAADWKIFSKAGRLGILAFIPGINVFTEYGICWSGFMGSTLTAFAGTAGIAAVLLHAVQSFKLARSFGHGLGYGIFLILFGPLARIILGLGDSRYVGRF